MTVIVRAAMTVKVTMTGRVRVIVAVTSKEGSQSVTWRPSPVLAEHGKICQVRSLSSFKPNSVVICSIAIINLLDTYSDSIVR